MAREKSKTGSSKGVGKKVSPGQPPAVGPPLNQASLGLWKAAIQGTAFDNGKIYNGMVNEEYYDPLADLMYIAWHAYLISAGADTLILSIYQDLSYYYQAKKANLPTGSNAVFTDGTGKLVNLKVNNKLGTDAVCYSTWQPSSCPQSKKK